MIPNGVKNVVISFHYCEELKYDYFPNSLEIIKFVFYATISSKFELKNLPISLSKIIFVSLLDIEKLKELVEKGSIRVPYGCEIIYERK